MNLFVLFLASFRLLQVARLDPLFPSERNKFGILDHDVTLPSGAKVYNPMRVLPNNDGCELIFTLYQLQIGIGCKGAI